MDLTGKLGRWITTADSAPLRRETAAASLFVHISAFPNGGSRPTVGETLTYEPGRGWDTLNLVVSIGAFIQAVGVLVFIANLIQSYWNGARAGKDPWDAWTLEWSVSSPPPAYNFASIPIVSSRRPLWDLKHPEDPDSHYE